MTNSQHNDKKHNASTVTTITNSQHNDKKCNACMVTTTSEHFRDVTHVQAQLIQLNNLQWTFLTMKSLGKLHKKSPNKKTSNTCDTIGHMSQPA